MNGRYLGYGLRAIDESAFEKVGGCCLIDETARFRSLLPELNEQLAHTVSMLSLFMCAFHRTSERRCIC